MTQVDRTNWPLVLALWAAGLGAAAQFGKIAVIFDGLGAVYPGGTRVGFVVSVVGLVGLALGVVAGLLVQRVGYRRVLVGGLALGAVMSVVQVALPPYPVMILTRIAEGVSHLSIVVAGPVLIASVTAPRHLGAAMTLWSSFFGVSFALLAWGGVPLVEAFGMTVIFWAHAGVMAALALLLARMIPPGRITPETRLPGPRQIWSEHLRIYASPFVAAPALSFVFYTAMYVALLTLVPQMIGAEHRVLVATAMPLVSIGLSLTLGVWLLGRISPVNLALAGFALSGAAGLVLWLVWGQGIMTVLAALALAGALGLIQGASFATIPVLNPAPGDRAHAAGALAQMGNLGTTSGTPVLAAMTIAFGVNGLLAFVLPLSLGGMAMLIWLARRRARLAASRD